MLTAEQKERLAPAIRRSYRAVADDAGCRSLAEAIEVACDADRPVTLGRASPEDYAALSEAAY